MSSGTFIVLVLSGETYSTTVNILLASVRPTALCVANRTGLLGFLPAAPPAVLLH